MLLSTLLFQSHPKSIPLHMVSTLWSHEESITCYFFLIFLYFSLVFFDIIFPCFSFYSLCIQFLSYRLKAYKRIHLISWFSNIRKGNNFSCNTKLMLGVNKLWNFKSVLPYAITPQVHGVFNCIELINRIMMMSDSLSLLLKRCARMCGCACLSAHLSR